MKVTRQQLYTIIRGKSAVSPDMALRLEKAFGGGAAMWLGMQSAYDLAQARKEQGRITIRRLAEHRMGVPSASSIVFGTVAEAATLALA